MKKVILILLGLNSVFFTHSQELQKNEEVYQVHNHCGFDHSKKNQMEIPGFVEERNQLELFTQHFSENYEKVEKTVTITIPVVFHINKSSAPTQVTLQQVQSAIDILNEDYNAQNGSFSTVRPEFQTIKANVGIHFCLASIDPDGNPTSGVTYHTNSYDGREPDEMGTTIKTLSGWPANKYLNIWTTRDPAGTGDAYQSGWAFLPYTPYVNQGVDGIIYNDRYLGKYGTGASAYNDASNAHMCHVLSHEVGHYLNLDHTFENYCSAPGDNVSDTPPVYYYGSNNCEQLGTKCPGVTLVNDENYMDYAECPKMFTNGQKARMLATLNSTTAFRKNLWSDANLVATGCSASSIGVNELTLENQFYIAPNPNNGNFEVVFNSTVEVDCAIEIQDLTGRIIAKQEYEKESGNKVVNFRINPDQGVYNCVIISGNDRIVKRIVIN